MKKSNLFLSLVSATAVLGAVSLASCGKTETYDPDNFIETPLADDPYKIVKNPITINIFTPHSAGYPNTETLKMYTKLSELTNLKFKFNTPDTSAYQTQKATVWTGSTEMPDLFLFNNDMSEIVQFAEGNFDAYTPLNKADYVNSITGLNYGNIIEKYMPNYKNGLDTNFGLSEATSGNAKKIASLSDGTMYSTLSVNDVTRDLTFKMYLNKKWIEDLNSGYKEFIDNPLTLPEDLTTLDELYRILKAFKDYDANGNGDSTDEVPITSASMKYIRNYFLSAFGHVVPGVEIKDDWSAYEYTAATPAYREYLKFCNKLYSEGIIDRKTFDMTSDTEIVKRAKNKNIVGSFVHAAAYLCVGSEYQNDYVTIKPVRSSSYTGPLHQWSFSSFKPDGATIPAATAKTREVARLLDIMYSPLGQQLLCYGAENEDWHWDNEEHTSWSADLPNGYTADQAEEYRAYLSPNVGSGSGLYWSRDFVYKQNDEVTSKLNELSDIYVPYFKIPEPYEVKMNSTEYAAIAVIKAGIDDRIDFNEANFIKGISNPNSDTDWNKYISELEKFEYREMVDYYNAALARYVGGSK